MMGLTKGASREGIATASAKAALGAAALAATALLAGCWTGHEWRNVHGNTMLTSDPPAAYPELAPFGRIDDPIIR